MPNFKHMEKDGFKITWLDDGHDYPAILDDYFQGKLAKKTLSFWPDRETHKIQVGDRPLLIKRSCPPPDKLKRRLWDLVSGFTFSRLMRDTWAAKGRGDNFIAEIYLVAEKVTGFNLCPDSYQIAEFIEGEIYTGSREGVPPRVARGPAGYGGASARRRAGLRRAPPLESG